MSLYQFFASDKPMPEFDNMHAEPVIKGGEIYAIKFRCGFNEETAIRIIIEDDLTYASQYTNLSYVNYIEWCYSDDRAEVLIDYIRNLLKNRKSVSLYNTWLDDKSELGIKKIHISKLTIEIIKDLWGKNYFNYNECCIIYH
ncbi:hypothetical protein [Butyrivibrio sp. AC2005]|uniref:hypothetical protein n=1 Tax=Butyrivibrio sp. AC2005 TaxID=1280672 RepID=UPI0005D2918C|nr:hypothetical protein [Butyrivibrio sp. AC2005]